MPDKEILLVYDTQCPACHYYCQLVRIRESVGQLRLVDAREPSEVMNEITAAGLDIDQGMILKMGARCIMDRMLSICCHCSGPGRGFLIESIIGLFDPR